MSGGRLREIIMIKMVVMKGGDCVEMTSVI